MKPAILLLLLMSAAVLFAAQPAPPPPDGVDLPEGFSDTVIATGLTGATAMEIAPDGRIFVCEQTGTLRVIKDGKLLSEPFVTLPVDSYWERGLLGIALHPDFGKNQFVYLCYVAALPYPHHRVSRFTAREDKAVPDSEVILLEGDDQRKLGGSIPAGHQGGAIHFGKDGKLHIAIGEQTAGLPAQRLDTFQGKMLRINPDGSIPEDNPFYKKAKDKYRAIWALGLRNPFAFAVQPGTGRIYINDVGDARWEEINEGTAGANYGWPESEGYTVNPKHRTPIYAYDHSVGRSITGGVFYNPAQRQFPEAYVAKYFFADYMDNWIRVLDPRNPRSVRVFATGLAAPVDLKVGPDGSLYCLNRQAWVKDDKFTPNTGSLVRITYTAAGKAAPHITEQPLESTVIPGQAAVFRVRATGVDPLNYQWQRDGKNIAGENRPGLTVGNVKPADDGTNIRCVVSNDQGRTRSARARITVATPREPAKGPARLPGLAYEVFEGQWPTLPAANEWKPARKGTVKTIDLGPRTRDSNFGMVFHGFLDIAEDGAYAFDVESSGTAKLYIAGAEVAIASERWAGHGAVGLKRGRHALLLLFAHRSGRPKLEVSYSRANQAPQPIPAEALSHDDSGQSLTIEPLTKSPSPDSDTLPYGMQRRKLATALVVPHDPALLPPLLSQTGVFRSLIDLTPNAGIVPYTVNAPLWSDGAAKRRWIALPGDARIDFAPTGEWKFPPGTVFIKHFELEAGNKRLETRLLVVDRDGGHGVTYKWRPDGSDAELLRDGLTEEIDLNGRKRLWSYPSRNDCLLCHTTQAGFILGVKTRQLNGDFAYPESVVTDNQLRTWSHLGMFKRPLREADIPHFDRLASVADTKAPLEHRVRSYLDSNCAHCHRPGGARAAFDARYDTPLSRQNLLDGPLAASDLGVAGAKLVTPSDPSTSMIYLRMNRRRDVFNMPPLASHEVDGEALAIVEAWIKSLEGAPQKR
jgi:uncharacterized repeat protein (TIGR03806 family)